MSTANSIHLPKHVKTNTLTYDALAVNSYGGKYSKVHHGGRWLLVQTPKILCPFGINVYEDKDKDGNVTKKSYSLDISFSGYEPAPDSDSTDPRLPKVRQLYDLVGNMETALIKHCHKNSFTWLDDPDASEPVCKALLRSNIKWSKDKKTKKINKQYPPRMKFDLPVYDGDMKFKAYIDSRENQITDIDELVRRVSGRCQVVLIAKCDKVTFNGSKYGYKWIVQQLKVYSTKNTMNSYAFIEDSDDEGEQEMGETEKVEETPVNMVEDSDELDQESESSDEEEEEEEEEEEKPPTPKPTKKKRVVRRKKKSSD